MGKAWVAFGVLLGGLAIAACSPSTPNTSPGGGGGGPTATSPAAVPVRMLDWGTASQFDGTVGANHELVAATPAAWQQLYGAHRPDGTAPDVDFTRERVVGVILGRPTTGFHVALESVTLEGGTLVVTYVETAPPAGATPVAQLTQPYFFAAVANRGAPVSFKHQMAPE